MRSRMRHQEAVSFWTNHFEEKQQDLIVPNDYGPSGKVLGFFLSRVLSKIECRAYGLPYAESIKVVTHQGIKILQ